MSISANKQGAGLPRGECRHALGLVAILLFAGCTVGPDFSPPPAPAVGQFTNGPPSRTTVPADGVAQRFVSGENLPAQWWHLFNCPKLDTLVSQGFAGNPSITAAEATLAESQDTLKAGYGVFYPQLDSSLGATRQRSTSQTLGQSGPGRIFNVFTLSATVSYSLDIFGGERRSIEGLGANVAAQRDAMQAAYLTLSANIVDAAIAMAAYRAEIDATAAIIATQHRQVSLALAQSRAGIASYASVLTLQAQVESTTATLPPLRQKLVQTEDLIAALTNRLPADLTAADLSFADLSLPRDLPVSLPSALVHQRPDILGAEANLHAASAEIGVATAALYPNFTLDGGFGFSNSAAGALFAAGGELWSAGAGVTQPLFHGGTLWFQRKAAIDAYHVSAANYRATVLNAFEQVADSLRAIEHDAETLAATEQTLATAARALKLTQANYTAGTATYTELLSADTLYDETKIGEIQARTLRYQDTVSLFAALGGGWWNQGELHEGS